MNEIQIFKSKEFGNVRTLMFNNEPYLVGKDVAVALGYAKPENALSAHVDDEDKTITLIQVVVLTTRVTQLLSTKVVYIHSCSALSFLMQRSSNVG